MTDTAFAIYLLIAYSWVVGWIIACGRHYDACRAAVGGISFCSSPGRITWA